MKKIIVPTDLSRKELFKFLADNEKALINQKKSMPIKYMDGPMYVAPDYFDFKQQGNGAITKAAQTQITQIPEDATEVFVKVVGNAMNYCDHGMDVLLDNCAKRSISQRKGMIPHLPDHTHKLEAEIGDVEDIYLEDVPLKHLGYKGDGNTQCIIMESMVQKSYNPKVFDKYRRGRVKQHSIGLQYVEILLCMNEPDDEWAAQYYKNWKKYYDVIINKDFVDEMGFFWAVKEIRLLEISGVLFGMNELTPTLEVGSKDDHSPKSAALAHEGGPAEKSDDFDIGLAILTTKFF